ncbi:YgfZ/GcvT domain-containing protein [Lacunimicrobium album]
MQLYPLPRRTRIALTGKDRQTLLHGFCTNEIKKLIPGQGCEAFITNIKARVLGHVFVAATEEALYLDTVPDQATALMTHLDRYIITEDAQLADLTDQVSCYFATTASSEPQTQEHGIGAAPELAPYAHALMEIAGTPVFIQRLDWFQKPGYLIVVPVDAANNVVGALESQGLTLSTADQFERDRIAAGFPLFGKDVSDANLPQEVDRTELAISFKKGCYLGQEPIARLDALGHVNKILRRVTIQGSPTQSPITLIDPATQKEAGTLTSIAASETPREMHALGYLKVAYANPGTSLVVIDGTSEFVAIVN